MHKKEDWQTVKTDFETVCQQESRVIALMVKIKIKILLS